MFRKVATAQHLLRLLHEKQAGYVPLLVAGAGLAAGAHTVKKGLQKGREYKAGFTPGYIPEHE